jgi:WD40 repeat protein
LESDDAGVIQVAFSLDGKTLVSGSNDQALRVWDIETGIVQATFHDDGAVQCVAVSPDGRRFASGGESGLVKIWARIQAEPRVMGPGHGGVAFSPDGLQLATAYWATAPTWVHVISVIDARTGTGLTNISGAIAGYGFRPAWSPRGRYLGCPMSVWDRDRKDTIASLERTRSSPLLFGTAFSADESLVAGVWSGTAEDPIRIHESQTGRFVRAFPVEGLTATCVDVSPDGRWIVAGTCKYSADRILTREFLKVWDLSTGQAVRGPGGFRDSVYRVRFSADGRFLAAAIGYKTGQVIPGEVRIWNVATWELVWRLRDFQDVVYSVAFSPDGRRLVSGGGTKAYEVKVWDLSTGQEVWTMPHPPEGSCYDVAFSPCGRRLALVGTRNQLLLYDGTPLAETPTYQPLPNDT